MYGSDYMNKIKTILIGILSTICFMLAIVCVFLALAKDDTPPEITFDDIILSYTEGDDTSILFTGVSASDLVDGDVTDRMIIKSITMEKDGFATVTYAVTDTSNNVTERSRRVIYKTKPTTTTSETSDADNTSAPTTKKNK